MKNLFIVFEGIDGSGTSTQASLLQLYFQSKNRKVVETAEPSNGPIGHLIREGMKRRIIFSNNKQLFDQQMAYLFVADRHDHLYNDVDGVIKLLEDNTVISTRYYFSSLAYHCNTEDEFLFVKKINERFPDPDLVIYINNPVEVSLKRISNRYTKDVYENRKKLSIVKENYDKIFSKYEKLFLEVSGEGEINAIHKKIVEFIEGNWNV